MCKFITATTVFSILLLPIAILLIVSGEQDRESGCQEGTRASLYLHEWNFIQGLHDLVLWFVLFALIVVGHWIKLGDNFLTFAKLIVICDILWLFCLFVIGIVILATNENNSCVAEGKYMAVVAIVSLAVGTELRAVTFIVIPMFLSED